MPSCNNIGEHIAFYIKEFNELLRKFLDGLNNTSKYLVKRLFFNFPPGEVLSAEKFDEELELSIRNVQIQRKLNNSNRFVNDWIIFLG